MMQKGQDDEEGEQHLPFPQTRRETPPDPLHSLVCLSPGAEDGEEKKESHTVSVCMNGRMSVKMGLQSFLLSFP